MSRDIYAIPHLDPADRRAELVARMMAARGLPAAQRAPVAAWGARAHGLDLSPRFAALSPQAREEVLARLAQVWLEEALLIERAGMVFASQMALDADTIEARELYATFAADEARHHHALTPFVDAPAPSLFHGWLEQVITSSSVAVRVVVVQVVLEGWGLEHYGRLAEACEDPDLAVVLRAILRDEAWHHQSGVLAIQAAPMSREAFEEATSLLRALAGFIDAGPSATLSVLEAVTGEAGWAAELDVAGYVASRRATLNRLLERAGLAELAARAGFSTAR